MSTLRFSAERHPPKIGVKRKEREASMLPLALLLLGCHARIMTPSASFTLLSDQLKPGDPRLVGTGSPISETACVRMWTLPLSWWGDSASYEDLVSRALDKYDADVLLEADIKDESFGFLFYQSRCTTVTGRPAIFATAVAK